MITLDTNTIGKSTTQYDGFEFDSMARFGSVYLGVNENGLFVIGAPDDDGQPIEASFELPTVDLGSGNIKRLRFLYMGAELYGDMLCTLHTDGKEDGREYDIPYNGRGGQQRVRVPIGRDDQGRYWRPAFANVNGGDFSVDSISVLPVVLHPGYGAL